MRIDTALAARIDRQVKAHATYVPDPEMDDQWVSYADTVLAGGHFRGDCDDWAMTALELLYREGVPKDRLYRAMVSTTGAEIDHMIGLLVLDDGAMVSVGDTMYTPRRAYHYDIRQTSRMDERRSDRLPLWRYWDRTSKMTRTASAGNAALKISSRGLKFIKGHEKFMARAYDDFRPNYILKAGDRVRGTLTIGYGHTGPDVKIGDVWSEEKALQVLDQDLDRFEAAVRRLVRVVIDQPRFDALVSFAFNVGEGTGGLATSTLLKKINGLAPLSEIQAQFRRWTRSKGVVLRGLVKRRDLEAAMYAGNYPITTAAMVATPSEPKVTPVALVEETKKVWQSVTVWGSGVIAACPVVIEAARELRNMGVEVEMGWVTGGAGTVMAAASAVIFAKRIYEIAIAARR